ncbi:hypothetical protein A1Q2_00708 [Trichosporon asahii var. asahii CBS 8904]|uniref:Uncharacterized protein n=1 Tax=Trichosporon asahii var. asahii (strain CBS 8904) TaxID=1220162 RepID=K1WW35_TRIAC|nr:hypothetical protein A1Q2_00708 [Trichosporon asahii var. asahii CBS 8904]
MVRTQGKAMDSDPGALWDWEMMLSLTGDQVNCTGDDWHLPPRTYDLEGNTMTGAENGSPLNLFVGEQWPAPVTDSQTCYGFTLPAMNNIVGSVVPAPGVPGDQCSLAPFECFNGD